MEPTYIYVYSGTESKGRPGEGNSGGKSDATRRFRSQGVEGNLAGSSLRTNFKFLVSRDRMGFFPSPVEHLLEHAALRIDLLSVARRKVLANTDKSFFLPLDE